MPKPATKTKGVSVYAPKTALDKLKAAAKKKTKQLAPAAPPPKKPSKKTAKRKPYLPSRKPAPKTVVIKKGEDIYAAAERALGDRSLGPSLLRANPQARRIYAGMKLRAPPTYGAALTRGRAAAMRPLFNPPDYATARRKAEEMLPPPETRRNLFGINLPPMGAQAAFRPPGAPPLAIRPLFTPPQPTTGPAPAPRPAPQITPAYAPGNFAGLGFQDIGNMPLSRIWHTPLYRMNREYVVNMLDKGELPFYILDATLHDPAVLQGDTYEDMAAALTEMGFVRTYAGSWVSPEMVGGEVPAEGKGGGGGGGGGLYQSYGGYGGGGRRGTGVGGRGGGGYDVGPAGRYINVNDIGPISWRI